MKTIQAVGRPLMIPIIDIGQLQENPILSRAPGAGVLLPSDFFRSLMGNGFCTRTFKKRTEWSGTMRRYTAFNR